MRRLRLVLCPLLFASILPSAEIWTGELLDATCVAQHKETQKYDNCIPAERATAFLLQTSGRMLKLDADGNRKAAEAWKNYRQNPRVVDPDVRSKAVTATIEGTVNGDELKVESIQLR